MAVASCDPNALESAARCFRCIPPGLKPSVNVSLLNSISGANQTIQQLLDNSRTFDRFSGSALGAEVYLLALIAGLAGQTPGQLANAARCFDCGRDGDLDDITGYLYAVQAGGSTVPANVISAATSYQRLFGVEDRISLYLTCQWAVMTGALAACDVASLLTASRCYTNCLSRYLLRAVRTYLLCYININGMGVSVSQATVTDWANRVVTNGGAAPSPATRAATVTFLDSLAAANIRGKIISMITVAPDNLIAAITPVIKQLGSDPWVNFNNNFLAANLTVNGLLGDGLTKWLQTGHSPADIVTFIGGTPWSSFGYTVYIFSNGSGGYEIGSATALGSNDQVDLNTNFPPCNVDTPFAGGAGRFSIATPGTGYYGINRTATNQLDLYFANSGTPHSSVGNAVGSVAGQARCPNEFYVWGVNAPGNSPSPKRMSFVAFHQGFSAAESLAFFNAVQALRTALGGGFV